MKQILKYGVMWTTGYTLTYISKLHAIMYNVRYIGNIDWQWIDNGFNWCNWYSMN